MNDDINKKEVFRYDKYSKITIHRKVGEKKSINPFNNNPETTIRAIKEDLTEPLELGSMKNPKNTDIFLIDIQDTTPDNKRKKPFSFLD